MKLFIIIILLITQVVIAKIEPIIPLECPENSICNIKSLNNLLDIQNSLKKNGDNIVQNRALFENKGYPILEYFSEYEGHKQEDNGLIWHNCKNIKTAQILYFSKKIIPKFDGSQNLVLIATNDKNPKNISKIFHIPAKEYPSYINNNEIFYLSDFMDNYFLFSIEHSKNIIKIHDLKNYYFEKNKIIESKTVINCAKEFSELKIQENKKALLINNKNLILSNCKKIYNKATKKYEVYYLIKNKCSII